MMLVYDAYKKISLLVYAYHEIGASKENENSIHFVASSLQQMGFVFMIANMRFQIHMRLVHHV